MLKLRAIQMVSNANPFLSMMLGRLENRKSCILTSEASQFLFQKGRRVQSGRSDHFVSEVNLSVDSICIWMYVFKADVRCYLLQPFMFK